MCGHARVCVSLLYVFEDFNFYGLCLHACLDMCHYLCVCIIIFAFEAFELVRARTCARARTHMCVDFLKLHLGLGIFKQFSFEQNILKVMFPIELY